MKIFLLMAVFCLLLSGCVKTELRVMEVNQYKPYDQALLDITYAKIGDKELHLDVYYPKVEKEVYPLVVYIHGGSFIIGDKNDFIHKGFVRLFLDAGFAVSCINYRYIHEAPFPAPLNDCKGAIRFLKANSAKFRINPDNIGVMGDSAGGYYTAMIGVTGGIKTVTNENEVIDLEGDIGGNTEYDSRVAAVCEISGPSDFQALEKEANSIQSNYVIFLGNLFIGTPPERLSDRIFLASPINYVSTNVSHFLIIHGMEDPIIPFGQSQIFFQSLYTQNDRRHREISLYPVKKGGHFNYFFSVDFTFVADYFKRHLTNG